MAKAPDGTPLTAPAVEEMLKEAGVHATVAGVVLVQAHADIPGTDKSGRHSELARIALEPAGGPPPRRLIIKRVACAELPERGPAKWARDIQSYNNDVLFYKRYAERCAAAGLRLPRCYRSLAQSDDKLSDPAASLFYLVLEDLEESGFQGRNVQSREDASRLLRWLARLHSVQWEDTAAVAADLFPVAGTQSYDKRDAAEIDALPQAWAKVLGAWEGAALPPDLGERLRRAAPRLHAELERDRRHTGLIHGDFKSANLFHNASSGEVSVVDWQWAGAGKVVRELPYFLWGALDPDITTESAEQEMLAEYHRELTTTMGREYPWELFLSDYRLAFVDYVRHIVAYMWPNNAVAKGPEATDADFGKHMRLVHNKSSAVVRRMAAAASARLGELEGLWAGGS